MKFTITRFMTLAKTGNAHLAGDEVQGRFADRQPLVIGDATRFCERFANWRDTPEGVIEFTRRYAPLQVDADPGRSFRFAIADWRKWHRTIQWIWKNTGL